MRAKIWLMIASIVVANALLGAPAWAQTCHACIYSVKFICGVVQPVDTTLPSEPPLKPGNYATAINVHNFHERQTVPIIISKKAVIANPENQQLGDISRTDVVELPGGRAIEIDCADIASLFPASSLQSFIKGFVDLRGPDSELPPLSVTAVYTAQAATAPGEQAGPVSIEVVPVHPFTGP